jgi:asparagine synthase (glutamine-hydrolysing)
MRRLSIIDLAGGHQPVFNEDKTIGLVYNGEVYNYHELRSGLLAKGHTLVTQSDTETIAHLYEDRGAACVEPLRGMFAFALWDSKRRKLLLARDRFGIKPLYIAEGPWGIAFASELKALVAAGLTNRELDWEALDTYFQIGYIPAPGSPFRDVRKLLPGHTLEWEDGKSTVRQYWDLPRERREAPPDVEEAVLHALDESVKAHLVSDVPVAAFLSGGIDSSAVVASMALAGEVPHAFTARYRGVGAEEADETSLARLLAGRYGAKLSVIDIDPDVNTIIEPVIRALDEPHADESSVPTYLISQAVAKEYKVALTGTGGDELFAGYRRHIGLLAGEMIGRMPAVMQASASVLAQALPEPRNGSLGVDRLKRFLRTRDTTPPERLLGFVSRLPDAARGGLYAAHLRERVHLDAGRRRLTEIWTGGGSPRGLNAALYMDYKAYLPDDLLLLGDRLSMAHSLEARVPFVDHRLVELVYPLPDRTKIGLWKNKRLLRDALGSRLPAEHFRAKKRGFVGPTASWLRHELRPRLEEALSPERVRQQGFFDPGVVSGLCADHFEHRHNREGILWGLFCFELWHRLYVESPAAAAYSAR